MQGNMSNDLHYFVSDVMHQRNAKEIALSKKNNM